MARAATAAAAVKSSKAARAKQAADHLKSIRRTAVLLKHVADTTRLQVMLMLREGEMHVGAICGELTMSQPAVSHHLALLRHSRLIEPRRDGKHIVYSLTESGAVLARKVASVVG
jgi:DNA-binding transcriptional ArsR family regulator